MKAIDNKELILALEELEKEKIAAEKKADLNKKLILDKYSELAEIDYELVKKHLEKVWFKKLYLYLTKQD